MCFLGSSSSTTLCSRLVEHYNQITYLYINDIANIDDDDDIGKILDLKNQEHRYDSIQRHIEQHHSNTRGFLIAGHLNEKNFCKQWQEKVKIKSLFQKLIFIQLGRIDLIILLSSDRQAVLNQNFKFLQVKPNSLVFFYFNRKFQIDSNNDFDTILANSIRAMDEIFPQSVNLYF